MKCSGDSSKQEDKSTPETVRCAIYTRKSSEEGLDRTHSARVPRRSSPVRKLKGRCACQSSTTTVDSQGGA